MVKIPALLYAALLLQLPGSLTEIFQCEDVPFKVEVENGLQGFAPLTFSTHTKCEGILQGGMTRLMDSNAQFKFTYSPDQNYGPYLESVNGVAGIDKDRTYWQLLVKTPNDIIIRPKVGIGCYIPRANETIILKFSKW